MISRDVAIENKLLAKKSFLKLDKILNRFNIFEATDMGRREIKHTKFLSYLLNPNESHGLGEFFIKNFVTRLSEVEDASFKNFPRILDLDFSIVEVEAELGLENGSLDLFIRIPYRGSVNNAELIIAIENKLDSTQGNEQLKRYTTGIQKLLKDIALDDGTQESELLEKSKLLKIYLTFNEDSPGKDNESWVNVRYSDVVLPTVYATIEFLEETGSEHIKATLKNYYELLIKDEDGEKEKDELANELIQEVDIKKYVGDRRKDKDKRESFGLIYVKHKKVIDYLCQFDSDIRTPILNWWKPLKGTDSVKDNPDLILEIESSSRSYLRFNVLSESNRKKLVELSQKDRTWLVSLCPIAFELVIKPREDNKFSCCATLVLGPIESDEKRLELIKAIYPALQRDNPQRDVDYEKFTGFYTRLISSNKDQWIEGKTEVVADPKAWIGKNILKIKNDHSVELEIWIKDVAVRLNSALDDYFGTSTTDTCK